MLHAKGRNFRDSLARLQPFGSGRGDFGGGVFRTILPIGNRRKP